MLPVPVGSVATIATDINDNGQIVGTERDSEGHQHALMWTLAPTSMITPIDIKPGDPRNRVNPHSHASVAVALLSTGQFDAATVRFDSVCFGDADDAGQRDCTANGRPQRRDVNHDGLTDIVFRFDARASGIGAGDSQACVFGETMDGVKFSGCDTLTTA